MHLVCWIGPILGGSGAGLLYTERFLRTPDAATTPAPAQELKTKH